MAAIYQIDPLDLDPLQLGRLFGIDTTGANYDPGDKAALGALLTALLLMDTLFWNGKGAKGQQGIQAIDWLIRFLTFAVALTVGWNWLLQETELTGPGPYLLAVMSNFWVWVLLIIMGLVVAISFYVLNNLRRAIWRWVRIKMDIVRRKSAERKYKKVLRQRDEEYLREKNALQTNEALGEWLIDWEWSIEESRVEYDRYRTAYWQNKAVEKLVESPKPDWNSVDGCWGRSRITGEVFLTDKGVAYIRAEIRKEALEGSEMYFRWATMIIAGLGIVWTIVWTFVNLVIK